MIDIDQELRAILADLVADARASAAAIVPAADDDEHDDAMRAPLGGGAHLAVRLPPGRLPDADARAAVERCVRAVRACQRRWMCDALPAVSVTRTAAPSPSRVVDRIVAYLQAFAASHGVVNAAVTVRSKVVTSAVPLTEYQAERIPFALKQIEAEARRHAGQTSHVAVLRDDLCAFAFWVGACLIAFVDGSHSPDFLRHRARLVTRELSLLLPHLDDDPNSPANVAPIPE
ncbi:MAG: hypothetical protein D6689_09245 [Deltaproteobacteria bacterium]|nr:MAG: hypothetical protein D6689_09245 [Deltaproteobacteria bacterium]